MENKNTLMKSYFDTKFHIILGLAACVFLNVDAFAQEIKVMTFNIFHGEVNGTQGKSNLQQVAELINQYQPDFVALQEVDSMTNRSASLNNGVRKELVQELARLTGLYGYFGKAIDFSNGGYGEGILSRFPAQSQRFDLPTPEGGENRALLVVEHCYPNGQKIIFCGTHFCHEYAKNQEAQAEALCDLLEKENVPVIVAGDFNVRPDSKPYSVIVKAFIDVAVQNGNPKNTIPSDNPLHRIDYIFVSKNDNWVIKDVLAIQSDASDHLPVLAILELKTKKNKNPIPNSDSNKKSSKILD